MAHTHAHTHEPSGPFVKPHMCVKLDPLKGRCITADRGVPAGTAILVAEPFAAVALQSHCALCFKSAETGVLCGGCTTVNYCSKKCQRAHFDRHSHCCHGLRRIISETSGHAAPPTVQLAVEAFLELAAQRTAPIDGARSGVEVRDLDAPLQALLSSPGAVLALETHRERLDVETIEGIAASALMLARVMQFPILDPAVDESNSGTLHRGLLDDETEIEAVLRMAAELTEAHAENARNPKKRQTADELTKALFGQTGPFSPPTALDAVQMFCRIRHNVFSICDAELRATGVGIYPLASLFNHSCEPNCIATFRGKTLYIRTIRSVRAYEELTLSYCDVGLPTPVRLQTLREGYFFSCRCRRCELYVDHEEQLFNRPTGDFLSLEEGGSGSEGGQVNMNAVAESLSSALLENSNSSEEDATSAAISLAERERAAQHEKFSALAATVSVGGLGGVAGDASGAGAVPKEGEAEDSYMKALLSIQLQETESLLKRLRQEAERLHHVVAEVLPPRESEDSQESNAEGKEDKEESKQSSGDGGQGDNRKTVEQGGGGEGKESLNSDEISVVSSSGGTGIERPPVIIPSTLEAKDAEAAASAANARAREAVAALSNALTSIGEAPPQATFSRPQTAAGRGASSEGVDSANRDETKNDGTTTLMSSQTQPEQRRRTYGQNRIIPRIPLSISLSVFTPQDIQLLGVRCTRKSCRGVHIMMPPQPLPNDNASKLSASPRPDPSSTCTQCSRTLSSEDSLASSAVQRRAAKLVLLQKSGAKVNVVITAGLPLLKEMLARLTLVHYQVAAVANCLVNASVGVRDWNAAIQNNKLAISAFQFAYPPGHPLPALQQALQGKMLHFTYEPAAAVAFFRDALGVILLSHGRDSDLYKEISDILQQAEAESLSDPANLPMPITRGVQG
jgi:hypothetical protein